MRAKRARSPLTSPGLPTQASTARVDKARQFVGVGGS
jgi:hypothetical protein